MPSSPQNPKSKLGPLDHIKNLPLYKVKSHLCDGDLIRLHLNENLFIPPNFYEDLAKKSLENIDITRYGSIYCSDLAENLAQYHGVNPNQVVVGNGADELISQIARLTIDHTRNGIILEPSFWAYDTFIHAAAGEVRTVLLTPDFRINPQAIIDMSNNQSALLFVGSPNNPTARQFSKETILDVIERFPGIVVVDEAYVDFARYNLIDEIHNYPNLVILRTLSKAWGAAGLRVGYMISNEEFAESLKRISIPFNMNVWSQNFTALLLKQTERMTRIIESVKRERHHWIQDLNNIPGITAYPSDTNFVLIKLKKKPSTVQSHLLAQKFAVRDLSNRPLLQGCLRVTVAPKVIRERFIELLRKIMEDPTIF